MSDKRGSFLSQDGESVIIAEYQLNTTLLSSKANLELLKELSFKTNTL
jgi:hypothetical protein